MKKAFIVLLILLILIMLVWIQKYFLVHSLFRKFPYTGIALHFIGGGCVYILTALYIRFRFESISSKSLIWIAFLIVFISEICWELIEVLLGWNDRQQLSYYLYNTAEDIVITLIGALPIVLIDLKKQT